MGRGLASILLALALAGCETIAYYAQAVGGQLEMVSRAQPVETLLADPQTPPPLRAKLATARSIREFASRELKLPDNGSYRRYADLGRPYAVWNVVAAPEFSTRPVQSCFPVAGCVSYRGFFAQADAESHAAKLRADGYDVFIGGVPAYSTLGWFDDPLLNTFINYPDAEVARLVFHELAHQLVYLKGDTTFNESFAVALEREGVRRWLAASGRSAELAAFTRRQQRVAEFFSLLEDARVRLDALYLRNLSPEAMREGKKAEFAALGQRYELLKRGWGGFAGYDRFFASTPTNALLASFATYNRLVPGFERLLAQTGPDLDRFYAKVRALAALDKSARETALGGLPAAD
jgi:predicted aminopeptidase